MAFIQIDRIRSGYSMKITPASEGAAGPWSSEMTESQLEAAMRHYGIPDEHIAQAFEALHLGHLPTVETP